MIEWTWAVFVTGMIVLYFMNISRRKVPERTKEESNKKVRDLLERMKKKREEEKDV